MKNRVLKIVTSLMLVVAMLLPMVTFLAPSVSAASYAEENGWINANPNASDNYAYSIAVVGDTQSLVKKDLTNGTNYMSEIYKWLAANVDAKKIEYVLGVGDITEYTENFDSNFDGSWTYAEEWDHAKAAITLLDGKVPYSLCRGGGHDTTKKFNEYFGSHSAFTGNISGTYTAGDYTSTYSTFEVGNVKYLLLTLDWNPSDSILAWAENIVKSNPDRRVIITTHSYLNKDGTLHGSSTSHSAVPDTNNGVDIWNKLVSKYDNIQLVISGHDSSANIVSRQDARESGSVVTSLLVDPQTFDSQNNGATGMVCMLYFSADGNQMNVEWYSTVRNQYYKSSNQYTLNLAEIPTEDGGIVTKYGVIPAKYTNADDYPFLTFVDGEFKDLGAYDLFNYASGTLERALRKLTAEQEVVVIARKDVTVIDGSNGYLVTNYIPAKVTVDLMGHTINANTTTPANLFSSAASQTFDTNLTVKNGSIIVGKALLSVSAGGGEKTQNFTFENINITSYYKELIAFNQYKLANDVNINFIDCNISAATSSALTNVFRSGSAGDTEKLLNSVVTVKGGSVSLTSFDSSKFAQENNGNIVKFLPNANGELTKVTVPTGTSIGDKTYRGANDTSLALVKSATGESGDVYSFVTTVAGGGIETPYGTIPMENASTLDYPFVAFVNGEFWKASDNIFIDKSGSLERAVRNLTEGTIVIILRRDFTLPEKGFFYTNYAKIHVTIDLMGHTVTNPFAENLFSSNGTQTHESSVTVKNGSVILAKALYSVSTHDNAPNKIQNITFENLNITTTYNHLAFHNASNKPGKVNITYINCNISLSNTNAYVFQAGKSATDTNFVTDIVVKGGSITLAKFDASRFVVIYNGSSVTFLPNEKGDYISVIIPNTDSTTVGNTYSTDKGEVQLVNFGIKDGKSVFQLRVLDKLVKPKASLTMHSSFVYNVYIPVKSFITEISLGGVVYDISSLKVVNIDGADYYHIEKDVGVIDAGEAIPLIVKSDVQKQSWDLDVSTYANAIINGGYNNVEKTLVRDILAYVRAAYVYANEENTAAVIKKIDAVLGTYEVSPVIGEAKESTNGLSGAGLLLGEKPAFYFIPTMDASLYTFTVNGAKVTTEMTTVNGKNAILVYTYAYAITETVSYTISDTDISGEYNLAAYHAFAVNSADANLVALVNALWQYSESAAAYKSQANS